MASEAGSDSIEQRRADEPLRGSDERFRRLVEGVLDYAIFMLDASGYITTWNAGAERIYGYRAEEILGQHFSRFYPAESVGKGWPAHELKVAGDEGRFEDEGWRVDRDGVRFWANMVLTALHDAEGRLQGFSKVTRNLTERRGAEESLRAAHVALERRVRERTGELARTNDILTREISQRQRLEQELRNLVEELQERDTQKNEFTALLAHELRNPLAPIRTAIECLRLGRFADPGMQRAADIIDRQARQMGRLIDDLLDLSRLTTGRLRLRKERVDLSDIVGEAVEVSRSDIESKNHQLAVTLPPDRLQLYVDPTRVVQILSNLLNNAAKFTPSGGCLSLTAEHSDGAIALRVRDNGVGVPADKLLRIFDIFAQVNRAWDQSNTGLGVGLALVKRLVQLHGGTVDARSEGLDRGSEFTVRLPVGAEATSDARHGRSSPPASEPLPRRILVVDDNEDLAESLTVLLSSMGSEVRAGCDGVEAIEIAKEFRPEAVLLDIGLPKLNGYDVARRIREERWGQQMLLVAMTGWGQEEDRRRTKAAGFDHHIVKPVDSDALRRVLSRGR